MRELREQAGLAQAQLAERIGVGQRQVSKIEPGDLDSAKVGAVRNYLETRVNTRWRICFVWREGEAEDVELVDYH
ncbi:helix-turn-helix domain-containing protein [Specibacter sp. NPDC078692]|uniref:helix-turn-helix domain-containing protein n=1 Tax=Specibacter sp. NPDC078692 TaxID=3155818 RepID=UPI003433B631